MINIETVPVGFLQTNCYILTDEKTGRTAVVDPGKYSRSLVSALKDKTPEYVILTHSHFDHIGGVEDIVKKNGAKIIIGKKEVPLLYGKITPDITLSDGDKFMLGETEIKFIETPGHTVGSGCYIFDDCMLSGDTLFFDTVGRTDLESGSMTDMLRSVAKLRELPVNYRVFPGHGEATTLDREKSENPYLKENGYEDIY